MIIERFNNSKKILSFPFEHVGLINEPNCINKLSFRESCNKIIHCLEYQTNRTDKSLTSIIIVKGIKGKSHWTTELECIKFIINGLYLIKEYDENWDISSSK